MKVVILAGGLGTRLSEETTLRPKPMVEIGGMPILWHIMSWYGHFGHEDFLIACGYKSEVIKEYFNGFVIRTCDSFVDLARGESTIVRRRCPEWNVGLIDTGLHTMTGGRIKRLAEYIGNETFMVTYGDGVSNVDIDALLAYHREQGRLATVTAVHPPARFGALNIEDGCVASFEEKPQTGEGWINGGFFVFEPEVLDFIDDDETILERKPLERLSAGGQLAAFEHDGFWQPMDTLREKKLLEDLWNSNRAPWAVPEPEESSVPLPTAA